MIYDNYQYGLGLDGQVRTDCIIGLTMTITTTIPNDPQNTDWMDYQSWLAQGNEPMPALYQIVDDESALRLPDQFLVVSTDEENWSIYQTWLSFPNNVPLPPPGEKE